MLKTNYKRSATNMDGRGADFEFEYSVFTEDTTLSLYHASDEEVRAPRWDYAESVMSKPEARLRDFGLGFYTCPDDVYPLKLASANDTLVLNEYNVNLKGFCYIEFNLDLEWLLTIAFHRRDLDTRKWCHSLRDRCRRWLSGCDVAIGIISNDKTYRAIEDFLDNNITDSVAIAMVNAANYGKQYVFKSQPPCDKLAAGFLNSVPYSKDQIMNYRSAFKSENQAYNAKADRLRMDMMRSGGGEFFEDIVTEGLFNGKVRF